MPNTNFFDFNDQSGTGSVGTAPSSGGTVMTIPTQPTAPVPINPVNNVPTPTTVVSKPIVNTGGGTITHGDPPPGGTAPVPVPQLPASGNTGIVPPQLNQAQTPQSAQPPASHSPYNVVTQYMNQLTSQNSPYMQNAARRGLELAATRGLRNSSIAAGASQRAAIEAAMPLVSEMTSLQKQREGYASQDWLASNQFNREFSGALALLPIQNSMQMLNTLFQYAAEDPAIYTPAVMNQMSNFFVQNMQNIMSNYFHVGGNP